MSQTINLSPGEVYTGSILIANSASATEDFHYSISIVPYNVSGEDYQIDTSNVSTYSQIANWITISEPTGSITPDNSKTVDFAISVPADAVGGAQSAAIIVSPDHQTETSQNVAVGNVFSLASIVYANISGETKNEGEILENNVPFFTVSTPVNVSTLVSNSGNTFLAANIEISVKNSLTGEQILSQESDQGNSFSELIMPESTRLITRNIENLPTVGVVHIEQSVNYAGSTSVVSHELVICPVWFMALVIAVIVGVISGIIALVVHHKRKKQII